MALKITFRRVAAAVIGGVLGDQFIGQPIASALTPAAGADPNSLLEKGKAGLARTGGAIAGALVGVAMFGGGKKKGG